MAVTIAEFINKVGFKVKNEDVDKVNNTISGIKDTATKLLGAIGIGFSLTAVNGLVEEFTRVNNQIRNATEALGDQRDIQEEIMAAAEATRTSYSDTANVVSMLVKGNSELFGNVDEAVKFNNAATMLFKSAGKTNEDIASLMEAINKSFQKGYVDSETISQLLERAPEAVALLNKRLGTTSDQLEDMATEGTMTIEDLKAAFIDNIDEIEAGFGNVQYSITDALTVIRSKWGLWLAQTNETLGITDGIGRFMVSAFNNVISVLNRVRNAVTWLADKLGGVDKLFRLIAITAAAAFAVFNFSKITSGLSSISKLLTTINVKTLAIIAIIVLLALLVEDFINFMQGNDSLIGSLLEKAGVDVEAVRQTIINAWNAIKSFLLSVWDAIKKACSAVWGGIKDFFKEHGDEIKAGLLAAWNVIRSVLTAVWNVIRTVALAVFGDLQEFWRQHGEEIKNALVTAWNTIQSILVGVWNVIKTVATTIFGGLQSFWQKHGEQITEALVNVWNIIKNVLTAVWTIISTIARTIFNGLKAFWDTWGNTILTAISGVWEVIKAVFSTAFNVIADLFAVFAALFSGDWGALWENVKQLVSDIFGGIVNIVSTILSAVWSVISSIFTTIWNFISGIAQNIWNAITTAFTNILTGITTTVTNIKDAIVNGFTAAIDWIKSLPAQALQWGADIINGIVDGIKGAIGAVGDAVKGVADKIKSFLGFSEPDEGPLSDFHTYMPDMIDLMSKGITAGKEKVRKALEGITGDMSVVANANVASPRTAAAAAGTSQISKSVVQNVQINNEFNGDRAGQQKSATAMDKAAKDSTAELARGLAYAR
jgi:tape measure domain-containing protein